jgi:hypothetical protein
MRFRISLFLLAVVWCVPALQAASTVVIHGVDDSTVTGALVAVQEGKIILEVKGTNGPATRKSIDLADISQTFFHDPRPRSQSSSLAPTTTPTTKPADTIDWRFKLTGGDQFTARIMHWSVDDLTIKSPAFAPDSMKLPATQIDELWCGSPNDIKKSIALALVRDAEDVAYVKTADSIVGVKGAAVGIAGDALQFQYSGDIRKISLAKLVGIAFAQKLRAAGNQALQLVNLDSGDTLSGRWTGLAKDKLQLRTPWNELAQIPIDQISTIDTTNGRLVYLSDLAPAKVEQTPFFGRVIPFRLDTNLDGSPLALSDGKYPKGIAMHARCVLQYSLAGGFSRFRAKVGLEQPDGREGRTVVRLLADNRTLYENLDTRGDQPPKDLDLDITAVSQLTLEADFGPSDDTGARVVWANARLLRPKAGNSK